MEIKVGSIYEHVNTGKSYVVTSISLLKIHGEWFEDEPLTILKVTPINPTGRPRDAV